MSGFWTDEDPVGIFLFPKCQTELSQVPTLSGRGAVECTTDNTGRLYQETQETIRLQMKDTQNNIGRFYQETQETIR